MQFLKRFTLLTVVVLLLLSVPFALAQDLSETYVLVDGTTFDYPDDFEIYDESEDGDSVSMRNDDIDVYVFAVFAETQEREDVVGDLPEILDLYFGDVVDFRPRDAEEIELEDGREAARYDYVVETDDGDEFDRMVVAVPIEENGTVAVVSVIPTTGSNLSRSDESLSFAIINTLRYTEGEDEDEDPDEDEDGDVETFEFSTGAFVSYPKDWELEENDDGSITLVAEEFLMFMLPFSADDLEENEIEGDLEDMLLSIVSPLDESIELRARDVDEIELDSGLPAVGVLYRENNDGDEYDRLAVLVQLEDDSVVFTGIVPLEGVELTDEMQEGAIATLGTLTSED